MVLIATAHQTTVKISTMKYILTTIENEARLVESNPYEKPTISDYYSRNSDGESRGDYLQKRWLNFEQTAIAASRVLIDPDPNKSEYDESELKEVWQILHNAEWKTIGTPPQHHGGGYVFPTRQVWLYQPQKADGEKAKYTDGPWELIGYEYEMGRHKYALAGSEHFTTMPSGRKQKPYIGLLSFPTIYHHDVLVDDDGKSDMANHSEVNHLANAILAAAAPELLEALQEMVTEFGTGYLDKKQTVVVNIAKAAIKRALKQ